MAENNIVGFKPRPATESKSEPVEPSEVAEFSRHDTGRLEFPQPDGGVMNLIFSMEEADWWATLAGRMHVTMPQGPYGRVFVSLNAIDHFTTKLYPLRKRVLEMTLTRPQFEQFVEGVPFFVLETSARTCQLSVAEDLLKRAEDTIAAAQIDPELSSAIFLQQLNENDFRLTYIEQ